MSAREVKLCLLGESGVGKSSLAHRFVHDNFRPSMESTIGASFLTKTINVDGKIFKYQIWDTAGQEKYRALAPMYYRGAAAAIIVYDITRQDTFSTLKSWINELHKHGPHDIVIAVAGNKADLTDQREVNNRVDRLQENVPPTSKNVLLNKLWAKKSLPGTYICPHNLETVKGHAVVSVCPNKKRVGCLVIGKSCEAESYAESVGAIFVETSAKTAVNIAPMFHAISQKLPILDVSSSYSGRSSRDSDTIKVKSNSSQGSRKKCC